MVNLFGEDFKTSPAYSMIREMVLNQIALNTKAYNEDWLNKGRTQEFDYSLAASQEIGEFVNSYGYEWWSGDKQDLGNCKMEIVDAVHFMLSQSVIDSQDADEAIESIYRSLQMSVDLSVDNVNTLSLAKMLMASLNLNSASEYVEAHGLLGLNAWALLFSLAQSIDFDLRNLYTRYMAKALLNQFRQDKGYKAGTFKYGYYAVDRYLKLWDGVNQDNYFLTVWLDKQTTPPDLATIKQWLSDNYEIALANSLKMFEGRYETSKDAV